MRMGLALHRLPRSSFTFQTKVGRYLVPDRGATNGKPVGWIGGLHMNIKFDYSGEAIERHLADSLQRTGMGHIDSLVIHDLEPTCHRDAERADDGVATARRHLAALRASGFGALQRLRASGTIKAFGAGVNIDEDGEDPEIKARWNREYVTALFEMGDGCGERGVDFLLCANLYSLLCDEANVLGILDECAARGISVVIGGPYATGILATGADPKDGSVPYYAYQRASGAVRAHVRRLEAVCARYAVPLIAAAIQYPLRHPAVCTVIPGGASAAEVRSNVALMNVPIPEELWGALKHEGLLPPPRRFE